MPVRSWLILLVIFFFTTVPVMVLGAYTYRTVSDALTNSSLERRVTLAKLGAVSVQERLDRIVELAVLQSHEDRLADFIEKGEWEQAVETISALPALSPYIDRLFLTDAKGIEWAASPLDPAVIGQSFAQRDWYKGVSNGWKPYVSVLYRRAATPAINVIAVAVPVFSRGVETGEPLAILVVQVPVSSFSNLTELSIEAEGFFYLVDREGNLVFHPQYSPETQIVGATGTHAVQLVLQGRVGYVEVFDEMGRQARISAFWPVSKYGWGVVMTQPVSAAFASRQAELAKVLVTWSVITFFSLVFDAILFWFILQLIQQREREKTILETIGEGIYLLDVKGKITYINRAVERLSGFSHKELIGQISPRVLPLFTLDGQPVAEPDHPFVAALRNGTTQGYQYLLAKKDGSTMPVEIIVSLIMVGEVKIGAVATLHDITERYQLDKAKDEFITTAAHQLNSPLGQIRWNLDLFLKKYSSKLAKPAKKILHDAHDSTVSLAALVNDLLIASRVTQDRLQEHPLSFKPTAALKSLVADLKPFITEMHLSVTIKDLGKVPNLVLDQLAFRQVFENILRNAIKYNREGGSIEIRLEMVESQIQISVADTGIGIPQEDIPSLFGKFFRAKNAMKAATSGTGLGLFVVKSYVERWNGKVFVQSEEGKGTTVFVRIPVVTIATGESS